MSGDQQPCPRCHGTRIISVQHGPVFMMDSEEEMMLAFHEDVCPLCKPILDAGRGCHTTGGQWVTLDKAGEVRPGRVRHGGDLVWLGSARRGTARRGCRG